VEIGPAVVEFAKRHFSKFGGLRFESVIEDGMKYAAPPRSASSMPQLSRCRASPPTSWRKRAR